MRSQDRALHYRVDYSASRGKNLGFYSPALRFALVPGTAAVRRRRQSMKPPVEVKSMNHRPAADCAPCRRRR